MMDSMLVWTLITASGLAIGVGILAGYLGFVAGSRDFRRSRLPGNATRTSATKPAPKVPTQSRLTRLHLYEEGSPYECYENLPAIAKLFSFKLGPNRRIRCRACDVDVQLVRDASCHFSVDNQLCLYCPNCFQARIFPNAARRREALKLPALRGNFLDILETLESEATTRNSAEPEKKSSFTATVEGTGGLRVPPMRVSVNPETQTVRPVEDEALAEAEVADHQASEAAKRTLTN